MIILNNNLRIFIVVAQKKSITQAAKSLYISQPAVSKAIKNLETEFHLKLFYRSRQDGLILTESGEKILQLANQMADIENRMYQTAFEENHFMGGHLRIASIPILTSVILAKALHHFKKQHPFVTVELLEGSSLEIQKAIKEYKVDFGVTSSPFNDLEYEVLLEDKMIAISQTPLPEVVDLYEHSEKYIFCEMGLETMMEELKSGQIDFKESLVVQSPETVIAMAANKNGIGIISELVLSSFPNALFFSEISPAVGFEIGILANDLKDLTLVALEFKRTIENTVF